MNAFTKVSKAKNDVKTNVWDWSHANNFTTEIGRFTPVFFRRVPAKTSLRIKPTFGLKFMPMMFPIQSQIKARISFFKAPVRALWDGYKDWTSLVNMKASDGTDLHSKRVPPYISISSNPDSLRYKNFDRFFGTGSDLDYMGLPTTFDSYADSGEPYLSASNKMCFAQAVSHSSGAARPTPISRNSVKRGVYVYALSCASSSHSVTISPGTSAWFDTFIQFTRDVTLTNVTLKLQIDATSIPISYRDNLGLGSVPQSNIIWVQSLSSGIRKIRYSFADASALNNNGIITVTIPITSSMSFSKGDSFVMLATSGDSSEPITSNAAPQNRVLQAPPSGAPEYTPANCPWYNDVTGKGLKVSSLPLRMREAVYNAYIRDIRNNPLIVQGTPVYNEWCLCRLKDGDDTANYDTLGTDGMLDGGLVSEYLYGRRYVNWEPDYLSTAVQSPQQGLAPLVGLTNYATVVSTDDNGVQQMRLNSIITDEDGNSYQVNYQSDKEGLKGVTYTELSATDIEGKPLNNLYQAITQGISIEDFRMVNAYQRYLELNMRRGYSYKDIVEGRYDVNVRFDELLMPEFCGGFTRDVAVSPVTQTVETNNSGSYQGSLGSQAGDAYVRGDSDASISIYCDEDSIVMGFISVSPLPIYSQSLSKDFLLNDILDIVSPEFSQIGFQPIPLSEVAPIQAHANGVDLNQTFGYQRPWYHLISMYDTAHGLFRSQLQNFIMKRTYSGVPALSRDFLLVKPEQVNQVFSVTETTDKIFGQIYFDCKVKNIVPRDAVPRLE